MSRILIPLPNRDFDPTEVAIPWQVLRAADHEFAFATPDGERAHADDVSHAEFAHDAIERTVTTNTAAVGGNATLLSLDGGGGR